MQDLINKIETLNNEIVELGTIKPEWQKKLDEKFRLEFSFNSNHLEGNTLTYGETKMLLLFGKTQGNHELREYEEMQAHNVAFQIIKDWAVDKNRNLTEKDIKELNEIILVKPFWKEAETPDGQKTRRQIDIGKYKQYPNFVRLQNGEMFEYASVQDTPIKMGDLLQWYSEITKSDLDKIEAIELAALLHYKFVEIHPFDDGNGRVARLLMNYVLLRNDLPPVVIKANQKKEYLFALNQADSGQHDKFIEYVAEQLVWSLGLVLKATKEESLEEEGDLDKRLELLKREVQIEDSENEIKTHHPTPLVVKTNLESWGYDLFTKLSETTVKFNEFYSAPKHKFYLNAGNIDFKIEFTDGLRFEDIEKHFENKDLDKEISSSTISFRCWFGAYKKGGIKPFGCSYDLDVEFKQYSYVVGHSYFDPDKTPPNKHKVFTERLLHIPLTGGEIDRINNEWGETLFNHLQHYRNELKG